MSNIKISLKSPSFTPLDNTFIDNYLKDIRGDFLKVYLFCLRQGFSERQVDTSFIASSLAMLETDVYRAFEELDRMGVLKLENTGHIEINSLTQKRDEEFLFDNRLRDMLLEVEQVLGRPLSFRDVEIFKSILSDYSLSPEVVAILVQYCISKNKPDVRYMEKVAISWHESGVKSVEDAHNLISAYDKKWHKYKEILSYLGKTGADITKPQEDMFNKWLFVYKFSDDIIFKACEKCILKTNGTNLKYIDAILTDWHKKGVKVISDIDAHKRETPKPNVKLASNTFNSYKGQRKYDMNKVRRELLGLGDE